MLVPISVTNPGGDGTTFLLTFPGTSGPSLDYGSLPHGVYDLTVHANLVTAAGGAPMAADFTSTFHRLFGDADGNQSVNALDYSRFKQAFGSSSSSAAYNAALDYDGNGTVSALDYAQFKKRFGVTFTY